MFFFISGELQEHETHFDTSLKIQEHAMEIVTDALKELQQHKIVSFKPDFEKEVHHFCKHITTEIENSSIALELIAEIQPVVKHIQGPQVKHTDIDKLCRDLYKFKVESSQNSVVARLLSSSSLHYHYPEFLKQMMTDALVKTAMKVVNKSAHDSYEIIGTPPKELDEVEQNVVRYCAGFVMYKFVKYLDSKVGIAAARYGNLIMSFQDEDCPCDQLNEKKSDTFMDYSKKLIEGKNRGGLFVVNNKAFAFFCQLEQIVKPQLSAANIGRIKQCSANMLKGHIVQTMSIQSMWEVLCRDAPEDMDLAWLLDKIVTYWLKLRMKAFGTAYMYARRRMDSKMEEKGAISMRKKL